MEFMTMEQSAQLSLLEHYLKSGNRYRLSDFFRTQDILDDDLLADGECYTFFQEIHAHNLENKFVNFTFIYEPPIDQNAYGIKDAGDILEEKRKKGRIVFEVPIYKSDLTERHLRSMAAFANHLGMSMYMSVADYIRMKRESGNLYGVSSIILDLDTYSTAYEYDTDDEIWKAMLPVFDRIGVEPNMYVNSGHGRYLVFSFNNVNLSVPEMQKLYKETVKKLIFQFREFGADAKCSDITRVFRIPGNINPKTGEKAYIVEHFEHRTTLSELASAVGICRGKNAAEKKEKNRHRNFQVFYKPIARSRYTKVNIQRDEDFNVLLELRNYDMEGCRNIFFHLMSVNCFYLGMSGQETAAYLDDINSRLAAPYDGLDAVIRYAESNYETYEDDYDSAVKYKNRTIVELLGITEEEQRFMKQLIGQEEADKRMKESAKKKTEKKRKDTGLKNEQLKEKILELRYRKLLDNEQIAGCCDMDKRTVTKMIGMTPKFVLIGRVDTKQNVFLCSLGHMTNAETARQLNISISTVKRMKKQLRSEGRIV